MAHYTGQEVAKILWDMEKFYDSLDICKLIDRANYLGYPSKLIAMGMIMHMAPRVIRAYEHHMEVGLPANGIIAGCTQSNHFARIFLYTVILALGEGSPYGEIRTFVDDIAQTERGKETYPLFTSKDVIVLHTVRRARILIRELRESNLVISEKTVVLANRKSTRLEIVRKLAREGLVCGHGLAAKDLGVGIALGRGRCTGVLKHRIKSTRGRVGRIKVLRRTHPRAGKLVNTGAMPQATYGKEVCGVSPGDMAKLRAFAAQAVSTRARGASRVNSAVEIAGSIVVPHIERTVRVNEAIEVA